MTRDELIAALEKLPADITFVVSRDEEGNGYRFADFSIETMCNQDGELVSCHPEDIKAGEYEGWEDEMFPAVVFW